MSLLKSKQINIDDLITNMATVILANPAYKSLWGGIVNNTFSSAVFSAANLNITNGQVAFSVTYSSPKEVFVYRNGTKQIALVDYSFVNNGSSFTITLTNPISASTGAILSEIVEINYY